MGRNKHFYLLHAPCGQHQELLHSRKELQPRFGSASFRRKATPGQDLWCNGFALACLSMPVTAARSPLSPALAHQSEHLCCAAF